MLTLSLVADAGDELTHCFQDMGGEFPKTREVSQVRLPPRTIEFGNRPKLYAAAALGLLAKNQRNLPILKAEHGPTPDELVVAVGLSREIARVAKGALSSAHSRWRKLESQVRHRTDAGARHRIVTHAKPDGDAIVSAWLAMRYLFVGEAVDVLFVPRRRVLGCLRPGDCLVDVGDTHDRDRFLYDHKPPALPARYDSCAARMVWEHLLDRGGSMRHLRQLVDAVHGRDSVRHRVQFREALAWSDRNGGFHYELRKHQESGVDDATVFRRLSTWLDSLDSRLRTSSS